jgi:O-succinylbenzoic acid--CoA ligase
LSDGQLSNGPQSAVAAAGAPVTLPAVRRLVALAMPAGRRFVDELSRAIGDGDAVLPVDPRLPDAAVRRLLAAMAPALLVDGDGERRRLDGALPVEEGDALVVPTSGTTGEPKGVVHTLAGVVASALATSRRLDVDPDRDRWLACLPLAHVGGLSVVTRALVTGTPLDLLDGFDAAAVERAARERGATLTSLVGTTLVRLGDAAGAFRRILVGGSAPPAHLPPAAVVTYGMTETGSGIVYDGVPLDGVEVRIGAADEVLVRGPMLLRAYRDGRDPRDAEGWLRTGDAGRIGTDGRLSLHGRISELIISGGENVWPGQVERILRRHPAVADVAVGGRPDPEWGERVVAVVVPDPRAGRPPALDELRELVKAELGPWAAPREVVLAGELPRAGGGKLRRDELRSVIG